MGLFSTLLAACLPKSADSAKTASNGKNEYARQEHLWRANPNPKVPYEITLKIKDAPGKFENVSFGALFKADGCSWIISDFEGVRGWPEKDIDFPFKKISDSEYKGIVFLDAMLNEDYYGNGVCQWQFASLAFSLRATGVPTDTRFTVGYSINDDAFEKPVTYYYWKRIYPDDSLIRQPSKYGEPKFEGGNFKADFGMSDSGTSNIEDIPVDKYKEYFTMTISAKKVNP